MRPGLLRRVVAALAALLPRALVLRLARLLGSGRSLSVVVVVTDDNAAFLADCVGSLGAQDVRPAEILLAVVGDAGTTLSAVRAQEAASWRVHRLDLPGQTSARALGHGAARTSGDLLVLLDAGDVLAEGALGRLAGPLDDPGVELSGAALSDLGRVGLADVMFRRTLWTRARCDVPEAPFAEWWTAARLVLAAGRTAGAGPAVRQTERRGTGLAFGTMPVLAPHVDAWAGAVVGVLAEVRQRGDEDCASFLRWLLEEETDAYLGDAERCTADEWGRLVAVVRDLLAVTPPDLLADLRVEPRVRLWLARQDHKRALEELNVARWLEEGQFPTEVRGGNAYAVLPLPDGLVPADVLALGGSETSLAAGVRRTWWDDDGRTLLLDVYAYVRNVASDPASSTAEFTLVDAAGGRTPMGVEARPDPEVNVVAGERFVDHAAGAFRLRLDAATLLEGAPEGARWHLDVELRVGEITRRGTVGDVDLRGSAGDLRAHGVGARTLAWVPAADGGREIAVVARAGDESPAEGWQATDLLLDGGDLVVRGTAPTSAASGPVLDLRGPAATAGVEVQVEGGAFEARLALVHDPWSLGTRPLPAGAYRLHVTPGGGQASRVLLSPGLVARTPWWQRSETYRLRTQRALDGTVLLTLAAPLAQDEVGPLAQQRLQRWYASDEHRLDPGAVYLQSYTGQTATDSPLAIHRALRRMRPDLTLHWAVADRSTPVPEGARPVLVRSRQWYAALATCGWLVTNIDMDRWFRKRPGQRLLQSFHGYPSKTMGIAAWEAKNFTPLRIERQLRRTSGTWDLLLTPTPAMDVHYRREYRYDGEILAAGYPRDDDLVGPDRERVRDETRQRLGVRPGQRAVLYAPTWRDDLATNFRAAEMTTAFDVERAAHALGDGYVMLLRGHRFHRRRQEVSGARLVDVTDYPEINDLVLASDAAVLDYSSLRFDFALTGRPMVFLVPDLDRYTGGVRGFLFDFRSSAPGPLVSTTDEVVERLRDLDGLAAAHRDDLARFNAEFNNHQDGHAAERAVRAFFGPGPVVGG